MLTSNLTVVHHEKEGQLPKRSTQFSAGYDIFAPDTLTIEPKETVSFTLPFSFTASTEQRPYIGMVVVRSSYGIKKRLRMVDSKGRFIKQETLMFDEGKKHVYLYNDGEETLTIPKGEHFLQFLVLQKDTPSVSVSFEEVSKETAEAHPSIGFQVREENGSYILYPTVPVTFLPREQRILSTGLKASFEKGAWLGATISEAYSSSLLFANATPVIDADYYNNLSNEGLIFIGIVNLTDTPVIIGKEEPLCVFEATPFYIVENDIASDKERTGGIGSTTNRPSK